MLDLEAVRPPEAPSLARGVAPESAPLLVFLPKDEPGKERAA